MRVLFRVNFPYVEYEIVEFYGPTQLPICFELENHDTFQMFYVRYTSVSPYVIQVYHHTLYKCITVWQHNGCRCRNTLALASYLHNQSVSV